jgi:hypothetical protein
MEKLAFLLVLASSFVQVAAETAEYQCDQRKCRNTSGFDCSFVDSPHAAVCANEYEVQDVSNVTTIYDPVSGTTFRYFTCCQPGYTSPPALQECTEHGQSLLE